MTEEDQRQAPLVVAVVLNYNGLKFLPECLETLSKQDYPNFRMIISDNGSTDGSVAWIRAKYPDVHVIENRENLGWSGGNNVGIRQALAWGAEWVWVINYDIAVEPGCVRQLVEYGGAHPDVGVMAPLIHYYEPRDEVWFSGGKVDPADFYTWHCWTIEEFRFLPQTNRFITGCAMMVRRDVWERVGLIDERFFMYLEDVDLSLRVSSAGYALAVVEGCGFYHKAHFGGGGSGQEKGSPFTRYHQLRSKLLLWRKHAGWWRFHTQFCPRHLAKYILQAGEAIKHPVKRVYGEAYINALWAFLFHPRTAQRVIQSPDWFVRLMARRAWLVVWLMSFGRRD